MGNLKEVTRIPCVPFGDTSHTCLLDLGSMRTVVGFIAILAKKLRELTLYRHLPNPTIVDSFSTIQDDAVRATNEKTSRYKIPHQLLRLEKEVSNTLN